jgi:hypothetical protein
VANPVDKTAATQGDALARARTLKTGNTLAAVCGTKTALKRPAFARAIEWLALAVGYTFGVVRDKVRRNERVGVPRREIGNGLIAEPIAAFPPARALVLEVFGRAVDLALW